MKGKMVSWMKRWWTIALVFALAMSLTSCSRRRSTNNATYGISYCDGDLGNFDVYTIAVQGTADLYKVVLIPVALAAQGDVASINILNSSTFSYKPLAEQAVLYVDQEVTAALVSAADLENHDKIVISTFLPGVPFLDQINGNPPANYKAAICNLPLPGDGVEGL